MSTERTGIAFALERNVNSRERNICGATLMARTPTPEEVESEKRRWEARLKQEARFNRTMGIAAFTEEFLVRHAATVSASEAWATAEIIYDFLERKVAEVTETTRDEAAPETFA